MTCGANVRAYELYYVLGGRTGRNTSEIPFALSVGMSSCGTMPPTSMVVIHPIFVKKFDYPRT